MSFVISHYTIYIPEIGGGGEIWWVDVNIVTQTQIVSFQKILILSHEGFFHPPHPSENSNLVWLKKILAFRTPCQPHWNLERPFMGWLGCFLELDVKPVVQTTVRDGKTGSKSAHLVLKHWCKTSRKLMCWYTTHIQTYLATNQVVAGLQKVESSSFFLRQNLYMLHVLQPKANLFCSKWCNSHVWHDSRIIFSNQKLEFTQLSTTLFVTKQVWMWVVKRATLLFNMFFRNVPKQIACFCCPFYP